MSNVRHLFPTKTAADPKINCRNERVQACADMMIVLTKNMGYERMSETTLKMVVAELERRHFILKDR